MAHYKKTSKYGESKTPRLFRNRRVKDVFRRTLKALKMSTVQYSKSHSLKYVVDYQLEITYLSYPVPTV